MLTSCNVDFDSTYLSIYIYIYVHGVDFFFNYVSIFGCVYSILKKKLTRDEQCIKVPPL